MTTAACIVSVRLTAVPFDQAEAEELLAEVFGNTAAPPKLQHAPDSVIHDNDYIDRLIDHSGEPIDV